MPEYLSPGVYMEEQDKGPKPIEGVGTAMPVFIGLTEKASENGRRFLNTPELVTSWEQYIQKFGDYMEGVYLPHSVNGFFLNGGNRCYVVSVKQLGRAQAMLDTKAGNAQIGIKAYAKSGVASHRLVVSVDEPQADETQQTQPPIKRPKKRPPLNSDSEANLTVVSTQILSDGKQKEVEESFAVTLYKDSEDKTQIRYRDNYEPRFVDLVVIGNESSIAELLPVVQTKPLIREHCPEIPAPDKKEFDGGVKKGDTPDAVSVRTGMAGVEALDDVTMVIAPDVMIRRRVFNKETTRWDYQEKDSDYESIIKNFQSSLIDHCSNLRFQDRLAIIDVPFGKTPQEAKEWRKNFTNFDSSYAAMYYPWIKVADPVTRQDIFVPPSGHMAGVWARTDNTRGVHKAPANEVVMGAIGLEYVMTKGEHDVLNPEGVNCIRSFPGQGIRAYGARTLSSNPSWRYIPIRRTMNFIKKSIERGTQWVVFEPNDARLWAKIRRDVGAFLTNVWREGMLFGLSPQEAFYVTCDESINPSETRREGKLFIEIGIQPVYPAEFVIFRISQWAGPGSEE